MTLLVFAKKSAEASITSIAILSEVNMQQTEIKNKTPRTPQVIPIPSRSFIELSSGDAELLILLYWNKVKALATNNPI